MNRDLLTKLASWLLAATCGLLALLYGDWTSKVEGLQQALTRLETEFAKFSAQSAQDRSGLHQEIDRCCYKK